MKLLLDTHVVLWALAGGGRLRSVTRLAITDPANLVAVSAASAWEITIKRELGKLKAPTDLRSAVAETGFDELPISFEHAETAGSLPRHHDDPFDRMLVAQALVEGLSLVTADPRLAAYPIHVLPA